MGLLPWQAYAVLLYRISMNVCFKHHKKNQTKPQTASKTN
jgi:hypothetical protein